MIDIQEFEKRYTTFEKLDNANYPYTFKRFWSYKLKVENKDSHILDRENRTKTATPAWDIYLKLWKWHEPNEFDPCFKKMEKSLETISDSYDRIRHFNLTEFDMIPENDLRRIWNEFSQIKDENNKSNFIGEIVETIARPLMLLWGQTPAFDSVVRTKMVLSNCPGFSNQRWEFRLWLRVMNELQQILNDNSELVAAFRKKSQEKYGIATIVPYGQFFDLYYWIENRLDTLIAKNAVTNSELSFNICCNSFITRTHNLNSHLWLLNPGQFDKTIFVRTTESKPGLPPKKTQMFSYCLNYFSNEVGFVVLIFYLAKFIPDSSKSFSGIMSNSVRLKCLIPIIRIRNCF